MRHLNLDSYHAAKGGQYELLRKIDDTLVIKYSHTNLPPRVLSVRFKSTEGDLTALLAESNLEVNLIEKVDLKTPSADSAFSDFLN